MHICRSLSIRGNISVLITHSNDDDFGYGSSQLHASHINTHVTGNGEEKEMEHYHSCKETQYHNSAFFFVGGGGHKRCSFVQICVATIALGNFGTKAQFL